VKIILSIFILFHLAVVVVLANGSSYFGRSLSPYLLSYANALGINCTWNFFSPDPANTMYYKVRVYYEDGLGNEIKEPEEFFFPPEKGQIVVNSSRRRTLYAVRFLTLDSSRLKTVMGPWICRQHLGASRVRMDHIVAEIPSLDVAVNQKSEPLQNLVVEKNYISAEVNCNRPSDEVAL
jgi:hypothetical protein